jgi:hypothetical protein
MQYLSKNPQIYIICGKARQGKDTLAGHIKEVYASMNKNAIIIAYADDIKRYAKAIVNWDGKDETKPREFLQLLGTDIVRHNISDLFFVNRLIDDIKVYSYFFDAIIISDGRYPVEIDVPKTVFKNAKAIHIIRPDFDNGLKGNEQKHLSEISLDNYNNYDYIVMNDGSIEDLKEEAKKLVEEFENER